MIEPSCKTCRWWEPFNAVCFNGYSPDCADFTDRNHSCDYWGRHECRCSGCLEAREFDGEILFHCYSCHAEFPYEVENPDIVPS